MERNISLKEISEIIGIEYLGKNCTINGLNLCNRSSLYKSVISYVTSDKYIEYVKNNTSINTIIVTNELYSIYKKICRELSFIITDSPEEVFYDLHHKLYYNTDFYNHYDFNSNLGINCSIHPTAFIDDGVVIGNNVIIGPKSVIKRGSVIGDDVIIGCNTVIGSEGFQALRIKGVSILVKHVGETHIKNNVCIGDNTDICNSLFEGATLVSENAKIDNLVHVAHNCYIGKNAVVTAGTILCGSSILDEGAWIGVNSSILNRVRVGKNSLIGIGSVVTRNIDDNGIAFGIPAKEKSKK